MWKKTLMYNLIILNLLINYTSIRDMKLYFNDNTDCYILISKTGKISFRGQNNDILWEKQLDKPLISTNINIKAIDFNQLNVLPGDEGRLYIINTDQNIFDILNTTIKDIVLNSPTTLPWLKKKVFVGTTRKKVMYINMKNGLITYDENRFILNSQTTDLEFNHRKFILTRSDYIVELRNMLKDNLIEWNATVSQLEVTSMDNKLQYSKDGLSPIDWNILEINQKEYQYIYKYDQSTGTFIKMSLDIYNEYKKDANDFPLFTYSDNNAVLYSNTNYFNPIILISLFIIFLMLISLLLQKTGWLNSLRNNVNNINEVNEVKPKLKKTHLVIIKKKSLIQNRNKNDEIEKDNTSQLSTKSAMNKSIDEMHRRFSQTISPHISLSLSLIHKDSAPVNYDKQKQLNKIVKEIETTSNNGNDEQLAPHITYQMKKIEKPNSIEKPKSAPPLHSNQYSSANKGLPLLSRKTSETLSMPKRKYRPSHSHSLRLPWHWQPALRDVALLSSSSGQYGPM